MANERFRLFKSGTELNYSEASYTKTDDHIVDSAAAKIEASTAVTNNSIIDFKKSDGTTTIFSPRVEEIKEVDMWQLVMRGYGYELNNIIIEQVYTTTSPEAIVQDIINTTDDLTYASTAESSGFTIQKYLANGYANDIILDMQNLLDWQTRIDESGNFYFEPKGNVDNGVILDNGTAFQITSWEEEKNELINHLKIKGGFEEHLTQQVVTATQTAFPLSHKPVGSMKVTIAGLEVSPDLYTVEQEDEQVVFTAQTANPLFEYTYNRPIVVDDQDDDSVATYGERIKRVEAPWLTSFEDARQYLSNLLSVFARPSIKAKGFRPRLDFDLDIGEAVTVKDSIRNKSENLVIRKITYKGTGITEFEFGSRDFVFFDWQREVMDRIKKIEARTQNEDDLTFVRTFKNDMVVTATPELKVYRQSPSNSLILGHETLGFTRTNLNTEVDASLQGNTGTWKGTGVGGGQYLHTRETIHYKLNNSITSPGSTPGGEVVLFAMDDDAATTDVVDTSGNSHTGTAEQNTEDIDTTGKIAGALTFNGTDDFITIPDHADFNFSTALSVACWVYLSDTTGAQVFVSKYNHLTTEREWSFQTNTKLIRVVFGDATGIYVGQRTTDNDVIDNDGWYHVCFTYDAGTVIIYINGVAVATSTVGTIPLTLDNETADVVIGAQSVNQTVLAGTLDEVRIYDKVLTPTEVLNLSNWDGGPITDSSNNSINGVSTDLTFTTAKINNGGVFNGSTSLITVTDNPIFNFSTRLSLAAWINMDGIGSTETVISKWSTTGDKREWQFSVSNTGKLTGNFGTGTGTQGASEITDDNVITGDGSTWYHVCMTYDAGTVVLYVDGVAVDSTTFGTIVTTLNNDDQDILIGKIEGGGSDNFFDGVIDDVRIYDTVLSATEVSEIANSTLGSEEALLSGWRLSNGRFNGKDYVEVADGASLDISNNIALSCALKVTALPSATKWIVSKYDGSDGYGIQISSNNTVQMIYAEGGSNSTVEVDEVLTTDEWKHYAFIKNGAELIALVDGVQVNTATGGHTIGTNSTSLQIGKNEDNFILADIDEVRVYNTAITTAHAIDVANKISIRTALVGYWAMDDPRIGNRDLSRKRLE